MKAAAMISPEYLNVIKNQLTWRIKTTMELITEQHTLTPPIKYSYAVTELIGLMNGL